MLQLIFINAIEFGRDFVLVFILFLGEKDSPKIQMNWSKLEALEVDPARSPGQWIHRLQIAGVMRWRL